MKIGIWNIYGPSTGLHSPASARKINAFQEAESPAAAFYLEAPQGDPEHLPEIRNEQWRRVEWVGAAPGNPRGILAVTYREDLKIGRVWKAEKKTALGLEFSCAGKKYQLLGIWTTPNGTSNSQERYFETLKEILSAAEKNFFTADAVCIAAGDTNVNFSAGAESQDTLKETSFCKTYREKLEKECKVVALDGELARNTLLKGALWYRCDHLMMRPQQTGEISAARIGKAEYMYQNVLCKSDHCPILFEI